MNVQRESRLRYECLPVWVPVVLPCKSTLNYNGYKSLYHQQKFYSFNLWCVQERVEALTDSTCLGLFYSIVPGLPSEASPLLTPRGLPPSAQSPTRSTDPPPCSSSSANQLRALITRTVTRPTESRALIGWYFSRLAMELSIKSETPSNRSVMFREYQDHREIPTNSSTS